MPRRVPSHKPPRVVSADSLYRQSRQRIEDNRFYASTAWRKLRAAFLAEHPLCDECDKKGVTEAAAHVHHVKERKTHPELALDWDNLQALCVRCHGEKRSK